MDARAIIAAVRDGRQVGTAEMSWFAEGLASGAVSDAQAGAFAMAVVQRGLHWEGRTTLTMAMRDSGDTMHWLLDGPAVDKHSTGGVGDSISLLLAPALAACGAFVPMISGRGLGHTGGTLDKMETIPGFSRPPRRGGFPQGGGERRMRDRQRLRAARPRRQAALRGARRHRDGGEH